MPRKIYAILFFAWLAILLFLTYYPDLPEIEIKIRHELLRADHAGHVGFYAVLAILFLFWQSEVRRPVKTHTYLLVFTGGVFLGALTEITQHFIHGRSVSSYDFFSDIIGTFAGTVAFYFRERWLLTRRKKLSNH